MDNSPIFLSFFFRENKIGNFIWIVCKADDSHEMSSLSFSDKYMYINKKKKKNTVDSRYLEFQGTLWNALRYPYLDISDLQNLGKNNLINHI